MASLVEPGVVNTPFFEQVPPVHLQGVDIASAVMYAITQPPHVSVSEMLVRPTDQEF